jgi:hypothetical protein
MGYLAKVRQADRCRAEVLRHMLSRLPRFRRCYYRWLCKGCRLAPDSEDVRDTRWVSLNWVEAGLRLVRLSDQWLFDY